MEVQDLHRYNRLVRRNLVEPLTHSCGMEYAIVLGESDEPLLKCFGCDSIIVPGSKIADRVRAINKEFYND